jgi:RHS repeat-associated protein
LVNAAGANLMVSRRELSTDTLIGTREIRVLYDGKSGIWRFSFDVRFDGELFVDETGASYDVTGLVPGAAIPGSVWSVIDADTIETRGGLAHHFDAQGRLAWIAWRGGDHPRVAYTWRTDGLELSACAQPAACIPFAEVELDAAGRPVAILGLRAGRRVEYTWDVLGRLVVARNPVEIENGWPGTRYEYSAGSTLLTAIVSSEGERIEYAWQTGRRIRQVTQVNGGAQSPKHRFRLVARDSDGLYPVVHINPLGGETRYRFDATRRLREVERSESGEVTLQTWDGLRVAAATLPGGETMSFSYQEDDVVTWTQPSGNQVSFSYAPEGRNLEAPGSSAILRIEDDLGLVESRAYDAIGRLVARSNGEGETTRTTHHPGDAVASITLPDGVVRTHPSYGLHGHWLSQGGALPDQRAFDPVGNPTIRSLLIEEGGVLGWAHDPERRVAEISLGASASGVLVDEGSVVIERRSDGQVLRTLRPYGGDDEHIYDTLGRRVERRERVDGGWQVTTFEYDAAGHLSARTRPNGMREEFERDAFGRVLRHRALRHGALEGETVSVYQQGRRVAFYDSVRDSAEIYAYDAAGRLSSTLFGFGESATLHYDGRSRRSREVLSIPELGVVADLGFDHDLADREVRVTDLLSGQVLVERDFVAERLAEIRSGNGLVRTRAYDQAGRLTGTRTTNASGAIVEDTTIEYGSGLAPPRQQIRVTTASTLASTIEEYGFELTGGLASDGRIGKRLVSWSDGVGEDRWYSWDLLSNRESDAQGNHFVYNAEHNRLLSSSSDGGPAISFAYDEAGYTTLRDGVPITWTAMGRMASHGDDLLAWDMRGGLIRTSAAEGEVEFTLFGGRVASDPVSGMVGLLEVGEVSITLGGGAQRYRHLDFRGNVSFASDESGSLLDHYHYGPFGVFAEHRGPGASSAAGNRSFVDRAALGGLMLLGERVYDPQIGRFLSPDPVRNAVNLYAYGLGNPVFFTDRDGRDALDTALAIGATVTQVTGVGSAIASGGLQAALLGVSFGFGGLLLAFAIAIAITNRDSGDAGGGIVIAPTPGFASASCSPRSLRSSPELSSWLYLLLPLQFTLAIQLLRRRRVVARI